MSRSHDVLIDRYAEHYAGVNARVDPRTTAPRVLRALKMMYGDLIAQVPAGGEILDLGCGTGFLLSWLAGQPGIIPVGVDASPGQVALVRQFLPDLQIDSSDGLPYLRRNKGRFEGVFCTDVLEHVRGGELRLEWLEAAREALRPGDFFAAACRTLAASSPRMGGPTT